MNRIFWVPSICILLGVSCTSREPNSGSSSQIVTSDGNGHEAVKDLDKRNDGRAVTKEEVVEKSKEALHLARDLAAQDKEEFVKEAKQRLAEMDRKIDDWEARSKPWADDARAKWEREREDLQRRRSQMQEELDKLKDKSGDAWRDMKAGATAAWDNLADSFRQAAKNFENK